MISSTSTLSKWIKNQGKNFFLQFLTNKISGIFTSAENGRQINLLKVLWVFVSLLNKNTIKQSTKTYPLSFQTPLRVLTTSKRSNNVGNPYYLSHRNKNLWNLVEAVYQYLVSYPKPYFKPPFFFHIYYQKHWHAVKHHGALNKMLLVRHG